jgi:hypothetical protein
MLTDTNPPRDRLTNLSSSDDDNYVCHSFSSSKRDEDRKSDQFLAFDVLALLTALFSFPTLPDNARLRL